MCRDQRQRSYTLGGLCGSIFVDNEFKLHLKQKLGSRWAKISEASKMKLMHDDWEHGIKRNFQDTEKKEWTVKIPGEMASTINVGAKKKQLQEGLKFTTYGQSPHLTCLRLTASVAN
jgi:hypothetical protein